MEYSKLTVMFAVMCFSMILGNTLAMQQISYNYKTGYENANGVPSGPMDLQPPTFEEMETFGTSQSGDAMENIFKRNNNISSDGVSCFLEGDIVVDCSEIDQTGRTKRNALRNRGARWINGVVPYIIDNRYDYGTRDRIQRALDRYHQTTCLQFVQRTTEADYIYVFPGSGCWSLVGRVGGMQQLSLGTGCTTNLGTIVHEFMHAVGFHHEQTRTDRDEYIYIYTQNISPGLEYNFEKYDQTYIDHLGTNYDYFSVMHYHMTAFSVNGQPTIVARDPNIRLDYRSDFSANDIDKINIYYECGNVPKTTDAPVVIPGDDCRDKNQYCADWAAAGECERNPQWMTSNCLVSCNVCDPNTGTGTGDDDCKDMNDNCAYWAGIGECDANPAWMLPNCPVSCDQCDTTDVNCQDDNENCALWARYNQCTENPSYMLEYCKFSCGQCSNTIMETCEDNNENCADWAAYDQCDLNPGYMNYNCRKSCGLCTASSPLELSPSVECVDSNGYCSIFASQNMCETKPDYMNLICPYSCGMCPGQLTAPEGGNDAPITRWSLGCTLSALILSLLTHRFLI